MLILHNTQHIGALQFDPFVWLRQTELAKKTPGWLTQRVQYMIEQSIGERTNEGYKSAFRQYLRFCNKFAITPLPVTEEKALYWLAHRTTEVQGPSANTNYFGLKKLALFFGQPFDDTNWQQLKAARKTLKDVFGANTPDKRLPITFELLAKMYKYFNMLNYNDLVLYTMMVCATTGLMRTSEICAANKKVDPKKKTRASVAALWNRQLKSHLDQATGLITHYSCHVQATKNEKGRIAVDIVWAKGKWPVSPCELITQYLHARINASKYNTNLSLDPNAPLFQLQNGTIVTTSDLKERLTEVIVRMGLDMQRYTIYSFRIGGATSLARRGIDHRMIQIAGRWRSDAYRLYIRMSIKSMAENQAAFLQREVSHPDLVFLHQNIPANLLVRA